MNSSHDILIIALIVIIVAVQLFVFFSVSRRIRLFKRIFPDAYHFKTVKVFVPSDQIAEITPDEILSNLHRYTNGTAEEHTEFVEVREDVVSQTLDESNEIWGEEKNIDESLPAEENDEIWMRNGNEELKVPAHLVQYHMEKGWTKIIPTNVDKDDDLPF